MDRRGLRMLLREVAKEDGRVLAAFQNILKTFQAARQF
jgi:hypothetical protein